MDRSPDPPVLGPAAATHRMSTSPSPGQVVSTVTLSRPAFSSHFSLSLSDRAAHAPSHAAPPPTAIRLSLLFSARARSPASLYLMSQAAACLYMKFSSRTASDRSISVSCLLPSVIIIVIFLRSFIFTPITPTQSSLYAYFLGQTKRLGCLPFCALWLCTSFFRRSLNLLPARSADV